MIYLACLAETMEDKLKGYCMISSREELSRVLADNQHANRVVIKRDFAKKYFTPSALYKYIENAKHVNHSLTIELDESSEVLTEDKFISKLQKIRNPEEALILLSEYPKEFLDTLSQLINRYNIHSKDLLESANTVAELQARIDRNNVTIHELQQALKMEQQNKFVAISKLDVLVGRINYQYNVEVDKNKLFYLSGNEYDKVLYIKELTRVQYVDTLIYALKEIFLALYSMPTRLVTIEPYYSAGKEELYPGLVPHYALKERDVLTGDILMYGFQPKLMSNILLNPSKISLLIILDRGGYKTPHLTGNNVEYIFTASDIQDVPQDIPRERVISYSEESLFIPYIDGFEELDRSARIAAYSSLHIVKQLVALVEGRC